MKRKLVAAGIVVVVGIGLGVTAGPAHASPAGTGEPLGITCQQYGLAFLRFLGAPPKITRQSPIESSLQQVLALHRTDPAAAGRLLVDLGRPLDEVEAACGPIAAPV